MKNRSVWGLLFLYLLLIQAAAEAIPAAILLRMNMIPNFLYIILVVVLLVLFAVPTVVFYVKSNAGSKRIRIGRRVVATLLSLLIIGGSFFGTSALMKVNQTLESVTQTQSLSSVIGVYVRADDPAETLADLKDYRIEKLANYDLENMVTMIQTMEEEAGFHLTISDGESISSMAGDLLNSNTDAIILQEAYADILQDDDTYSDFAEKTKLIYEYSINKATQWEISSSVSDIANQPFVVYLSGSDTRSKMLTTSRSDVNILAVVNPETGQILLVNTPRDYYVENPAGDGALDKLTHCGIYGIDCSVKALEQLYDEEVDYYAQINFTGFEKIVDAVGGIRVSSDYDFTTKVGGATITKGYNDLNGTQALAFARERYSLPGGDNDRGKNQMKVIQAIVSKMNATNVLSNYSEILDSIQGMFITDMSSSEIMSLVNKQLSQKTNWQVFSYAVSGTGGSSTTYSMPSTYSYVTYPDESTVERAKTLIDRVKNNERIASYDLTGETAPTEQAQSESQTETDSSIN